MKYVDPPIQAVDLEIVPVERSETIPSAWYVDPAFHEFDLRAIFSQTWQYIGHGSKLRNPGNQIVGTAADNPVVVLRDKENQLRAFYNVCRHRGGPLALEDCQASVLQCKYHGWTYLLDGSLRGTPKFDRTELFDKKDYGLTSLELDAWEDLVFVRTDAGGLPLAKIFEGIKERIAPNRLSTKHFHSRVVYDVNCNWKVYVDNYLEGYHLPLVHPELTTMLDYQNYVTETHDQCSLQYSAITKQEGVYEEGTAWYYFVFPNFMMNILPGRLQTNVVQPIAHDRCRVIFDYYYDDLTSESARKKIKEDLDFSDKVQQEDIEICERVQDGLRSRAYDRGRFSPEMEMGVYHFQSLLKKAYRANLG
jgi:choline monooxygenase